MTAMLFLDSLNNGSSVFVPLAVSHVRVRFNVASLHSLTRTFMQADVFWGITHKQSTSTGIYLSHYRPPDNTVDGFSR